MYVELQTEGQARNWKKTGFSNIISSSFATITIFLIAHNILFAEVFWQ